MPALTANFTDYMSKVARQFRVKSGLNVKPVANFTFVVNELEVTFTNTSTDSDGTLSSTRQWNFGDGSTSTAANPVHTYATGGEKQVTLKVKDNDGEWHQVTKTVTAVAPA